jgi:hypothetical protein
MFCAAPSEIIKANPFTDFIGLLAELFIADEYLRSRGRQFFFPLSLQDFRDGPIPNFSDDEDPPENKAVHAAFLLANNKVISGSLVDINNLRIPDLLNYIPERSESPDRAEFYEIKANSKTGRLKGRKKLADLVRDYGALTLPYSLGNIFPADGEKHVTVFEGFIFGFKIVATFHYLLRGDGLIVYEFCIKRGGFLRHLSLAMIVAILAAILIIIIKRKKIPIPVPGVNTTIKSSSFRMTTGCYDIFDDIGIDLNLYPLLRGSVGASGANLHHDVTIVQLLLNDWLATAQSSLLAVDGICGPKTKGAILSFQEMYTTFHDERIDPSGPTLKMLIALQFTAIAGGVSQLFVSYLSYFITSMTVAWPLPAILSEYYLALSRGNSAALEQTC